MKIEKITRAVILCTLILLGMSFGGLTGNMFFSQLNAQEVINSRPQNINSVLEPMRGDVWVNLTATRAVFPGDQISVQLKVWQKKEVPLDSIQVIYLAPNSIKRAQGDSLYTRLISQSMAISNSATIVQKVVTQKGKLDSIIWFIPTLPVIKQPADTLAINFKLQTDPIIEGSVRLLHSVDCYQIKKKKLEFENSATENTDIIQRPILEIRKNVIGKDTVTVGDTVKFQILIRNNGGERADSLYIIDAIPEELVFKNFLLPDHSTSKEGLERNYRWYFASLPPKPAGQEAEWRQITFSVVVREDLKFPEAVKRVSNTATIQHGEKQPGSASCSVFILSDPDLIPKIKSINKPDDWKLNEGIEVGIESSVYNIGGSSFKENFTIRYTYQFSTNPLGPFSAPILTWEVQANPTLTVIPRTPDPEKTSGFPIEIQRIKLTRGGFYRYCMYIIPPLRPDGQIVEKDTTNNRNCIIDTLKVPLRFFLSHNVYEPKSMTQLLVPSIQVPAQSQVRINIYNIAGELVKKHVDEFFAEEGIYYLKGWDGKDKNGNLVASGVYIFALETQEFRETRKVIVVR